MSRKLVSVVFETASVVVGAVLAVAIIFTFLFKPIKVDGKSMVPTLSNGDELLVTAAGGDYEYKDIVIVVEPNDLHKPLVKRVIATPGQWVNIDYTEGYVYVGDTLDSMVRLDEPYTASLTDEKPVEDINEYPIQVPEKSYFVMGDNRNHSTDSRSYRVGFIDENYILGKAFVRIVPFGEFNIYDD